MLLKSTTTALIHVNHQSSWCLCLAILNSLKVCFGFKYRILPSRIPLEENHNRQYMPCLFQNKKTLRYSQKYAKDQNTIGAKEISGEWERGNFLVFSKSHLLHLPCKGVHMYPQLPVHEFNIINSEKVKLNFSYGCLVCHHILSKWQIIDI